MKFDILKFRYLFIYFSLLITIASIFVLSFYKLKIGIDFTGGSVLELRSKIENNETIASYKMNPFLGRFEFYDGVLRPER